MTNVKTWKEYLNELPDIQIVTNDDVRAAMLNEIDDLRAALVKSSEDVVNISRERNALRMSADKWFDVTVQLGKELRETKMHFANLMRESEMLYQGIVDERNALQEKITEMNLQYISDFGQLQEQLVKQKEVE